MSQKRLMRLMAGSTLLMAAAAVTVAGVYVKNELRPDRGGYSFGDPQYVEGWKAELQTGIRSGPPEAPAKLLQFVDFQCPFCRRQAGFVAELRREYG